MGCSPIGKVQPIRYRRASLLELKDNPIQPSGQTNGKLSKEVLIIEKKDDVFQVYDTLEFIKEGKYGTMYKVQHKKNKNIRLMKLLYFDKMKEDDITKIDLINQIELLKNLSHPNIIQLYEIFNNRDKIYMIYEYCQEGNLFEYICKSNTFNEGKCQEILQQLLIALKYCHNRGVIHSDLCPEHIVIMNYSNHLWVKIIDFGAFNLLSYSKQILTRGFKNASNPYFVCPEATLSEKSDIWSVGVIMYFLLSGLLPFKGENVDELKLNIVNSTSIDFTAEIWNCVSQTAKLLIEKLLNKNSNDRPSADEALKDDFLSSINTKYSNNIYSSQAFQNVIDNIRKVNHDCKIKEGLIGFIVHHLLKNDDINVIRQCFKILDTDNDGLLSKEELIEGLKNVMTKTEAEAEASNIFHNLDVKNDACIKYEDFIKASISKDELISDRNLKTVFAMMDKEKTGKISKENLKLFFINNNFSSKESIETKDDDLFTKFISEMDLNGDGFLNFNEFKRLMCKC